MLTAGTRLGPYEILGALGAGGMGEVYKARDTRLDRTVAIKVLPDAFAADPQFRDRFDREARVVSQLTHPHICTLHDVGEHDGAAYLVMEYLEGQTLADRLDASATAGTRGLSLDEALQIAMQIADALDKAHRAGVVHRDLKPGNIMLTRSGARSAAGPQAKLLDFGLAKAGASRAAPAGLSMLPTTPPNLTAQGTILGTFQYMAPEQLEGGEADARTDIFAFGLILYEMVTGRKVFEGKSQAALIAAVLEHPAPPMSSVDRTLPPALEDVVQGCLAKDPEDRWQSARDVLRQLKRASQPAPDNRAAPAATPAVPTRRWSADRLIALGAALLIGAAAANVYWWIRGSSTTAPSSPIHLSVMLSPDAAPAGVNAGGAVGEISPDGKWIVYIGVRNGRQFLILRGIADASGRAIDGTDDSARPFFSPDGHWIAFAAGNELKKVPVSGGSPVSICTISGTNSFSSGFVGGAWGEDGTIVFVPQFNDGIWSVPSSGGTPRQLLKTDESKDRIAYMSPQVLPRSRGILFTVVPNRARTGDERDIAILETGVTEPRTVIRGGSNARFVPTGHLVYARGDALLAVSFDLARLEVTGTPVPVVPGIQRTSLGDVSFAIADSGTLLYEPFSGPGAEGLLAVVDRQGKIRAIPDSRGHPAEFSVSADGHSIAARMTAQNDDVWTFDIDRGSPLRLTFEPGDELWPQWTPDGKRIAFGSRTGKLFLKSLDGAAQREAIASGEFPRMPTSFSPDGKTLAFTELHPTGKRDVLLLRLGGDGKPEPFAVTEADESQAKFSPDGRWLAYTSNETGRNEIFIRPIGASGGRRRVSSGGGTDAAWARSGRELFFLKGDALASVGLNDRGETVASERTVLGAPKLDDFFFATDPDMPAYDVLPDGNHFVMRLSQRSKPPTHYEVVVNWFEELRRLVPAASR